jgi:hypothetical protein
MKTNAAKLGALEENLKRKSALVSACGAHVAHSARLVA